MFILNDFTRKVLAEYIKDMSNADMTTNSGEFTERANRIYRGWRGRGFCDFYANCPIYLRSSTKESIAERLADSRNDARIWISKTGNPRDDRFGWHTSLPEDTTEEKFLQIINDNRKMFGLQRSEYTQSEMSKAAQLLDDEMQYEI